MLKSVIKQKYVHATFLLDTAAFDVSVGPHSKYDAVTEPLPQHFYFVARPTEAAVSTRQNSHPLTFGQKFLRQVKHHRRLPRSSDRQVPNADYRRFQSPSFAYPFRVQRNTPTRCNSVN